MTNFAPVSLGFVCGTGVFSIASLAQLARARDL